MDIETKAHLSEATISDLQTLIRYNIDSYDGFNESAEEIDDARIAQLFRDIANERSEFATELQNFVEYNGEEPVETGSVAAAVHRAWINVRSKLVGGDAYSVLAEAERGEDTIKGAYESILRENPTGAMADVLQRQYLAVKRQHDKVRDMRDAFKNA